MPHKFNAARRHKFPKKRYRVTNWAEYTEILRRRGDLTIWVTDDTLKQWRTPRRTTPGGQPKYSNIAIETCLTLRTIYKLPLRQTQGLMRSIARLMGVDVGWRDVVQALMIPVMVVVIDEGFDLVL